MYRHCKEEKEESRTGENNIWKEIKTQRERRKGQEAGTFDNSNTAYSSEDADKNMRDDTRTVQGEEKAVARQRHDKHLSTLTNAHARIEELLGH